MVASLEICLRRLVKVKIALRHFHPGSSLRHFRPGRRYTSPYRSFNFQQLFIYDIFCATRILRVIGRQSIRQSTDFLAQTGAEVTK